MPLTPDNILESVRQRLPYLAAAFRPDARLDQLGLDSLDLVELILVADELFGVRLTVEDYKSVQTAGELAERLAARAGEKVHQP